ncbi:hypothetical protein MMC25_007372 [Agyrium rufum]|nr:hypothetical protein [Agyrium rufum]
MVSSYDSDLMELDPIEPSTPLRGSRTPSYTSRGNEHDASPFGTPTSHVSTPNNFDQVIFFDRFDVRETVGLPLAPLALPNGDHVLRSGRTYAQPYQYQLSRPGGRRYGFAEIRWLPGFKSILQSLPLEIFTLICLSLEPIWLFRLSQVCQRTRAFLCSDASNLIWWTIMPRSLWYKREKYQDESELLRTSNTYMTYIDRLNILDMAFPDNRSRHAPFTVTQRRFNYVIGASFLPNFNYKREILNYIFKAKRCNICVADHDAMGIKIHEVAFGLLLCRECWKLLAIPNQTLRAIGLRASQKAHLSTRGPVKYWFKYYADHLSQVSYGASVEAVILSHQMKAQTKEHNRVQNSIIESFRRELRQKIVVFAELLWEGRDPAPDFTISEETGQLLPIERSGITSPAKYEAFRTRFAPTNKLKDFLFPRYLLEDQPINLAYDGSKGWLSDPTKECITCHNLRPIRSFSDRIICEMAQAMLTKLVNFQVPSYESKDAGGHVDTWIRAADQYHVARLDEEIISGSVLSMTSVSADQHSNPMYARIRRLRQGVQLQGSHKEHAHLHMGLPITPLKVTYHAHVRPDQTNPIYHNDEEEWNATFLDARHTSRAASVIEKRVADFNSVICATCRSCPMSGSLFYPVGMRGLIKHMRTCHRGVFWLRDDWHVIG